MKRLSKEHQIKFYEEEIKKILSDYKSYIDSKCIDLINKVELYIGTFEYIDETRSQVVFSFPKDKLPKTKIPLTATIPKSNEIINSNFSDYSYSNYRKNYVDSFTDCYGVYYQELNGKYNVGFNNIEVEFLNKLGKGDKIVFGISDPPLKYYFNLIQITKNDVQSKNAEDVINGSYHLNDFNPIHIDDSLELIEKFKTDLHRHDTIIIQGPPGTGKTFFISRLLALLSNEKKSVLVATLANRSLIELAKKYFEIKDAAKGMMFKSNLTLEETKEVTELKPVPKNFLPAEATVLLTTFYKMTGLATENITKPIYDYVIIEEASQCFLGTIAAAKLLGKKVILVGDPLQLPPIVNQENSSNISLDIDLMQESFTFYASTITCPKFRLTTTYRFSKNACIQTNTFYENSLKSKSDIQEGNQTLLSLPTIYSHFGGNSLHFYDSSNLKSLYAFLYQQISSLLLLNSKFEIAILSSTKKGVKLLRDNLLFHFKDHQDQILINTVDGVQGLTVDFCFYFAYSAGNPSFSFKVNRFNVATSRARFCTLILLDEVYKVVQPYKGLVAEFISKCDLTNDSSVPKIIAETSNNDFIPPKTTGLKVIDKIDLSKFEKPKKEIVNGKENIYIIDTNVFVDHPDIISKIDLKYSIVLSAKVIDELDYLKISLTEEQKKNVQRALRLINESIDKRGIKMETADLTLLPNDFNKKSPDNFILSVALKFKEENPIMLTSDNGLQIKAKGLGITTITLKDFLNQRRY
ncbi:PIN domain-containing protein [Flavobacterium filum]|uniref:PIN domain-containing protein n=1 Tax=Flavobacterium filum TaxID=370974 RepID=UPI0023F2754B|nr:PIN domain-containing protein [Flavobacterium filum]